MRKLLRLTPVLLVLVAAPFGAEPASTAAPAAPTKIARVKFGAPVQVSADDTQAAAEPSIRSGPDGTLYIVAPTGIGGVRTQEGGSGGDLLWRSEDAGKTWTYLTSYDQAAGGGDADLAVDSSGVIWASGLTLVNTTAAVSTDKGDTFKVNPIGSITAPTVDRQWIETYKDEPTAYMTTGSEGIILTQLLRAPGTDEPAAEKTITVSRPEDAYQWPGELTVDEKNDFVFVSYNTVGTPRRRDEIVVTRSDLTLDETQTKQFVVRKTKGDSFDSFTAIDADKAGNVYVVWNERLHKKHRAKRGRTVTFLSVSKDQGETWSKAVKVNHKPRSTVFPWIVAGSKGRVAVVYYGTRARGVSPEKVVQPGHALPRWRVYASYSLNAASRHPRFREVKAVRRPIHAGNVCTSGTGCATGTRDLLDFFQDDLDPCGRIVITYTDNSADEVGPTGERTTNNPEMVSFVGQTSGPRFYKKPLNPDAC